MAQPFNLTAQINLRGPTNTRAIASQIRKQLSGIKVKVDLDVKGASSKQIASINKQLQTLNANAKVAGKTINTLQGRASKLGASLNNLGANQAAGALGKVKQQAGSTAKSISSMTSQIEEFGKQSGLAIRRFAAFSAVTGVVYGLTNAINGAFKEFVQFDKEVVRLSQVTGNSVSSLGDITKEITRLSTNLGVASNELITVSVTLAQAGLSAQDTKTALEALAKSALAPTFSDLNSTVEGSIALMKQFGISAEDLEESLGSINAVAASFAVEAGDIIAAIQRTGGVFASASNGVSQGKDALNEFIAVFTSVRATTREGAETIATGLRTIFTRIQRGSTIDALKEFGITLTDLEGKFVGPFEAIRRLSEGLAGLDPRDLRFGQIVEELGGFRQIGKVIPLIQQFATAQEALAVAQGGQDSLAKNALQAQQSLAVQFEKTRQSFVALVRDIGSSATFKGIATVALTTANAFITLASALKPLLPLLTGLAAIKGAGILSEFGSGFLGGLGKKGGGGGGMMGFAGGGLVPGSGSGDTVSAMLTPGEYVIRKKAVEAIGKDKLAAMNKYAGGGLVQKFVTGGTVQELANQRGVTVQDIIAEEIKTAGSIDNIKKLAGVSGRSRSLNNALRKNVYEKDPTEAIDVINKVLANKAGAAEKLEGEKEIAPSYALVGLRGSPKDEFMEAEDGTMVNLVGRVAKFGRSYEKQMRDGFTETVSDVAGSMAENVNAKAKGLKSDQLKKAGLYNAIGAYLEASVASIGAPYEKDQGNDPLDFANGLGPAASMFGVPSDMPADTTRTVFGKGKSPAKFLEQVNRYRAKKFATGGSVDDTVPALLTPGEFVINKKAANAIGMQKLNKLNKADKIQGFNSGGAVGYIQRFENGGGVRGDRSAYLERIAEKLGITVEQYERTVRADIISRAERNSRNKSKAQTGIRNTMTKNLENIGDVDVENTVREKLAESIARIDPDIDENTLTSTLDDIVKGMKDGMSIEEIADSSTAFKEIIDKDVSAGAELARAQEEHAKKLGFLTSRMKVRDVDVRAQRSLEAGKFGSMDKANLRGAQKSIETPIGRMFDRAGEALSTRNIPGMKLLERSFPNAANKVTALGDKMGGITGIIGSGSALLASKMPALAQTFDHFAGTVSDTSVGLAGFTGALEKGGSLGLSGAVIGQQTFGRRGAAIGGATGLAAGAVTGFMDSSIAKETENAFKGVTEAASNFDTTLNELGSARTVAERQAKEKELTENYIAMNRALEKSADTIEGNRVWKAFSAGIQGAVNSLILLSSVMAAMNMGGGFGGGFGGFGGGRRRRRRRAAGGRLGYMSGSSLVPVNLAPGEGVLSPEMASQFTDTELRRLNNADKNGFGANAGMLSGTPMGIVPGNGSGKVDNFKTNLAAGSYVIRKASMDALYAANGGKIGRGVVSGKGYASGGRLPRQGHAIGQAVITGAMIALEIGSFLLPFVAEMFSADTQKQQLQAELQQLEQLKRLTNATEAQSINNRRYSERLIQASEEVEARGPDGQRLMSDEDREAAYGGVMRNGEFNILNRIAEQEARMAVSAQTGVDIPSSVSVQEFMDELKTTDLQAYNKSLKAVTDAQNKLRRTVFVDARMRQGATEDQALKEFKKGGEDVEAQIQKEFARINMGEVLAQRMEIIGRSISKFTLNLSDIMTRLAATMNRVTVETSNLMTRLEEVQGGLAGAGATAGAARSNDADVLRNILAYSGDELASAVDNVTAGLGGGEQVTEMGDMVKGMQLIQKELPMILRNSAGQSLDENQRMNVDESVKKMFEGLDIADNIKRDLRGGIMDVIEDKTGGGSTQPMTFEELADQVPGLKELNAASEQARQTLLKYAEEQMKQVDMLGRASDRVAGLMIRSAELNIQAQTRILEGAMELRKQLGETLTLEELNEPFKAEINGLLATAGGQADMTPEAIGKAIADKNRELDALKQKGPQEQLSALESGQMTILTKEINAYQKALDKLANSTDMANNAMEKIAQQERISEARRQGVMGFLGMVNDPQAMMNFVGEQQSTEAVLAGRGSLNDIVRGIPGLQAREGTMTPEEFQKQLQTFVNNALKITEGAAGEGGEGVRALLETIQKDFAVGAEEKAKLNPEMALAIDAFNASIETSANALREQAKLTKTAFQAGQSAIESSARVFATTMETAATNVAKELKDAADRIGLTDTVGIEASAETNRKAMEDLAVAAQEAAEALRKIQAEEAAHTNTSTPQSTTNGPSGIPVGMPKPFAHGGTVYASKGQLINFKPKGTDTVPAMLTPGEFVVRKSATQKHLPLLKAINNGSGVNNSNGASYASRGGIMQAKGYFGGGVVSGMLQNLISGSGSIDNIFSTFIQNFRRETNNFGDLINNLARVFPALNSPINLFGRHVQDFRRSVTDLRNLEIKGPDIPSSIKVNSDTIRVELVAPTDNNYKLSDEDRNKITSQLEQRMKELIALGR